MQNYHRLFLASQERYDRLANLSGSGGAASIKSDSDPCKYVDKWLTLSLVVIVFNSHHFFDDFESDSESYVLCLLLSVLKCV